MIIILVRVIFNIIKTPPSVGFEGAPLTPFIIKGIIHLESMGA